MSKGSPSPKSPYIMTRISPKSPYIMAAKSPKSPMLGEKYKSGCAWGLINIFNLHQDRPSKKLISDRRSLDRNNTGNRHTSSRHNVLSGVDEKCQVADDEPCDGISLLEYAKENVEKSNIDSSSVGYIKKHRSENKLSFVCVKGCKDAALLRHKQLSRQISVDELLHKLDSAATTASFHNQYRYGRENGFHKKDSDLIQANDLAEAYVNQKIINGKFFNGGEPSSQSKQFLDALQVLNSNKDLFLKLLQDPNSLLVKHIEELREAKAKQVTCDAKLPEHCAADASVQSHYPETEGKRARPSSLTLGSFRRKLRHAIGVRRKEQHQFSVNNRAFKDNIGRTNSFESSSEHETASVSDSGLKNSETVKNHKQSEHIEARKLNREMPRNENEGKSFFGEGEAKTEGKTLGLPEYDLLHALSRRKSLEFLSLIDCEKSNDQTQISDSMPNSSENSLFETKSHDNICSYTDIVYSTDSQRIILAENISTSDSCRDSPPLESVSSTSSLEVSSSARIQKMEDANMKDGSDQPSPVSVLEQFCIEDSSIPADVIFQSAELTVQPRQISFEEQTTLSTSIYEHGSLTDYVRSVVQAASLNWSELSLNCHISDQLLEPSIYDEFEVSCSDHGLLFDCINENLLQVYQYYFRCSPWVTSFIKQKIPPFSVEEHVAREVVKCFDHYLLPQSLSQTLERLADTDLAKSVTWMDIGAEAEETVADVAERVLQEMIMEMAFQLQV